MAKVKKVLKDHFFEIFFFSLIFIFYSFNLSGQGLSLDEPETILVAKTILTRGYPSAFDGKTFISVINGMDSTKIGNDYVWSLHPWLQHYLVAGSFLLLGESIFSARIPFVIFGVLTILLVYLIVINLWKRKDAAFLTAGFLALSLPFFLYTRQVRHYSLESFFGLLSFYLIIKSSKEKFSFSLAFSLIFLFLSNYFSWVTLLLAGGLYFLIKKQKRNIISFLPSFIIAILWMTILKPNGGDPFLHFKNIEQIFTNIFTNFSYINSNLFPFIFIMPLFFIFKAGKSKNENFKNFLSFFGLLFVSRIIIYSIFIDPHGRYLYELIPYFSILITFTVIRFIKSKTLVILVFFLITFTNIFNLFPKILFKDSNLRFYPVDFYYELAGKYTQYLPWLGEYLKENSSPGDVFWSSRLALSIYYFLGVPQLSSVCNYSTGQLLSPGQTDKNKIKFYIFHHSDSQRLSDYNCFSFKDEEELRTNYDKLEQKIPESLYSDNDPDIINRLFPPRRAYPDEVIIFERK